MDQSDENTDLYYSAKRKEIEGHVLSHVIMNQ